MQPAVLSSCGKSSRQFQVERSREQTDFLGTRPLGLGPRGKLSPFEHVARDRCGRLRVGHHEFADRFDLLLCAVNCMTKMRELIAAVADFLDLSFLISEVEASQRREHRTVKAIGQNASQDESAGPVESFEHGRLWPRGRREFNRLRATFERHVRAASSRRSAFRSAGRPCDGIDPRHRLWDRVRPALLRQSKPV